MVIALETWIFPIYCVKTWKCIKSNPILVYPFVLFFFWNVTFLKNDLFWSSRTLWNVMCIKEQYTIIAHVTLVSFFGGELLFYFEKTYYFLGMHGKEFLFDIFKKCTLYLPPLLDLASCSLYTSPSQCNLLRLLPWKKKLAEQSPENFNLFGNSDSQTRWWRQLGPPRIRLFAVFDEWLTLLRHLPLRNATAR